MEHIDESEQLSTKYLIYIDILGFEKLPEEIATKSLLSDDKIREDFVRTIDDKINESIAKGEVEGKATGRDDWVLVTDSIDLVFKAIWRISNHNSGFRGYEAIPLEIAIGIGQYNLWAMYDDKRLIYKKSTVAFLKQNILEPYKKWYKAFENSSVKKSYVLFTEETFAKMHYFDKQLLHQVTCFTEDKEHPLIFYEADFNKVTARGQLYDFLEQIGKSKSAAFRRIDCAFVPSNEHERISGALEKQKVVFLIGDPEIGKTFTAVRFLWEYYQKGFTPIWNAGSEPIERVSIRQKLSEANVKDNSITYFEDPFGKRKFEDREELRRTISSVIKQIQMLNSRVIISSREQVFKEFEEGVLSSHDFSSLIVEMNLMIPSYNAEKKDQILLNWAQEFQCKWLDDEFIVPWILSEATSKLSTPLGLWDFAIASRDCDGIDEIGSLIKEKSKAIKASFADEIAQMQKQHIVFLSLSSVFTNLDYDLFKQTYDYICKEILSDQKYSMEILEEYFSKKVVFEVRDNNKKACHFTHPSYEEGVIESWNRIEVQPLFLKILDVLVHN